MMDLHVTVTNPRTTSGYGVYDVRLSGHGVEVTSIRRFTEFYLAICAVRTRFGKIPLPPPKKRFGNNSIALLKDRCAQFQKCLILILNDKRSRTHPKFRELIGYFEWKERVLALSQIKQIVLRGIFRGWAYLAVSLEHKRSNTKLTREVEDSRALVRSVRRITGASSSEPVSSLAHRMTSEFENLDRKSKVEGSRASSTESSVMDLCSEMFDEYCESAGKALIILRSGIVKLKDDREADSKRVSESDSKLKVIDELISVAKSIRSSGNIVPEDALFIIQEELVNVKNELRELKTKAELDSSVTEPSTLDIHEVSKQLALNLGITANNRFSIAKAVITSYSEKGKTAVLYSIEVISTTDGEKWIVRRRYNSFSEMRDRLGDSAKGISFPNSILVKSRKKRMEQLNTFLAAMVERARRGDSKIAAEVSSFLTNDFEKAEEGYESDDSYDSCNGSVSARSPPSMAPSSPRND